MQSNRWLLDANVTHVLQVFLCDLGIGCSNAQAEGWAQLSNGKLVQAAVDGGFQVLLTRDKLFKESASRTLRLHSNVSIVLLNLPQAKEPELKQLLAVKWAAAPIMPVPGQLVFWP